MSNQNLESFEFNSKPGFFSNLLRRMRRTSREQTSPTPSETSSLDTDRYSDTRSDGAASPAVTKPESVDGSESGGLREILGWRNESANSLFAIRRIRSNGIAKDYWMRDEKVKECYDCKAAFNTFRRRHHCRICGQIFCHKCASSIVSGKRFGYQGEMRVCDFCLKVVDDYRPVLPQYNDPGPEPLKLSASYTTSSAYPDATFKTQKQVANPPTLSTSFEQQSMEGIRKILGPSFFKKSDEDINAKLPPQNNVPFRNNVEHDDNMESDVAPYMTDEEYSSFIRRDDPLPKSFIKRNKSPALDIGSLDLQVDSWRHRNSPDKRKSPSLISRRKFSTRNLHRYHLESQLEVDSAKTLPRHFRSVSSALNMEINQASVNHVRLLMRQMLEQSQIDNLEQWETVIIKMLLNVCSKISPDIRNGDEIDIRHYVKIKKIAGGLISESHFVSGVVATKTPIHNKMLKPLDNPKILLLTFPLEYQRVENQFISLEPILAQENEHLQNLVGRLIVLKPDIILCEKTVARLALEFLLAANIMIVPTVKMNVMSAVARCTGAEIVHSIDKLSVQKLGTCDKFSFRIYINPLIPGFRKTFMYMEGCQESLGCTLALRGSTNEKLKKVKEIVDFLVFVVYSLKLETCLFQDEYAQTPSIADTHPPLQSLAVIKNDSSGGTISRAIRLHENVILSGSPNVIIPPPYLLTKMKQDGFVDTPAVLEVFETKSKDINGGAEEAEKETSEMVVGPKLLLENAERLSPFSHQNIMVLYSNICKNKSVPCIPPQPHLIEYYRDSDLTLGQFIEDSCFGSKFICTVKGCESLMMNHYRTYAHGTGKLVVNVDDFPCPVQGMDDRIMMWSLCRMCKESTPFIPMSEETWKYSFGKYLELTFYHARVDCRATACSHNIHKEHIRYFSFRNLTIKFEYMDITLFVVSGPPMHRKPKSETITKLRQQDMETIRKHIVEYYDSVILRMQNFTYEIVATSKLQSCKDALSELLKKSTAEKKFMLQVLHQTFIASSPTDCLAMNAVYKTLQDNVSLWETEFSNFIRAHLQSDARDIRRMTAAQIKRIFADKEPNDRNTIFAMPQDIPRADPEPESIQIERPILSMSPPKAHESIITLSSSIQRQLSPLFMREATPPLSKPNLFTSPKVEYSNSLPTSFDDPNPPRHSLTASDDGFVDYSPASVSILQKAFSYEEEEPEEAKQSDGFMYPRQFFPKTPRPKAIRSDTNSSTPLSAANERQLNEDEDAIHEFNTITGVAQGESEKDDLRLDSSSATDARPTSIMKTITNLWNGNPANFLPLVYPATPTEHFFPDSLIIVREDEPSSIISFALSSKQYIEKLQSMRSGGQDTSKPIEVTGKYSIDFEENQAENIEETLLRETGTHIRYQFWDGASKFHCKIYFAEKFDALRRNCGVSDIFEQSLARCIKWDASGGKSGSFFMKTRDDWLVVKKISQIELEALISFSPAYFEYLSQAFFHELPTLLAKIFGFYSISYKNPVTRKNVKMDILVMENLFYERQNISRIFDLKGSVRNRHVQSTGKQKEVLLDKNLLEFIFESPLFIREHSKRILQASVFNDTLFLSKLNVMDYSLLVGIDNESNELVIGIVDFIRTFTWDKKLESWVKETGLLGGGGSEPTIVTPRQYKNRFREAMDKYFLMVPDKFFVVGTLGKTTLD
ncbi:1-phosphatidylinositol-3-phosphate 5-kinase [Terramyces sp. JEL0728]|nr:1-phosphatidylinositol-3-phosphate 5-kinase [Terramyces sp. JEL0728]